MADAAPDLPPPIPTEFQIYNSYAVDPTWQRKFTIIWASVAAGFIVYFLPNLVQSFKNGSFWTQIAGLNEDLDFKKYEAVPSSGKGTFVSKPGKRSPFQGPLNAFRGAMLWTAPHVGLDLGQIIVVIAYYAVLLVCITVQAPLIDNPNRAGFMAIAQIPVVFLLATKNSLLSLVLGPGHGWEKLNFLHRWSGRGLFLSAAVHGSLWIRNHLQYDLPIIGQQKETSGVACFGLLCVIVLSSLKPVRAFAYQFFFVIHVLAFVAFFITVCYHTMYASPWIFPPLAFYGLDLLMRMFRFRVKDATLVPTDQLMTIIHVDDCDNGWVAGQHMRLRVFVGGRVFESHPLTILSAPPKTTCLTPRKLTLGARVVGDWTKVLNTYARANCEEATRPVEKALSKDITEKSMVPETEYPRVQVMIEGPYGGCSIDIGNYENVLLFAGGSGATFTIGMLDDIIGRCVRLGRRNGERTRKIEFAWCIKSFACINWFADQLMELAVTAADSSIDLHISVFVTCLCDPEAVPAIPNSDVTIERPTTFMLMQELFSAGSDSAVSSQTSESGENAPARRKMHTFAGSAAGGLAVCAAGPESLTREARNAVARLATLRSGVALGPVACHTEVYSI